MIDKSPADTQGFTRVVPLENVQSAKEASRYMTRKMVEVLARQGQIEPLQVRPSILMRDHFVCFSQDPHAPEILAAAKILGWKTVLIACMPRYEQ